MITIECEKVSDEKTVRAFKSKGVTKCGRVYVAKDWIGKKVRIVLVKEVK